MSASATIEGQGAGFPGDDGQGPRDDATESGVQAISDGPFPATTRGVSQTQPSRPGPYPEMPDSGKRWVPVAMFHLPMSRIDRVIDALGTKWPSRLVARTPSDDPDAVEVGYYVTVRP